MGCNCGCHSKLDAIGVRGCCFECEKEHDQLRNALFQVGEMEKLLADIHEAGLGLFLQLDPRGGVGERLSVVWDRLAPYVRNRNQAPQICMAQIGCMGGTCGKLLPCDEHPKEHPFTGDELKALQDSPFKAPLGGQEKK